jgi:hypothetical protein
MMRCVDASLAQYIQHTRQILVRIDVVIGNDFGRIGSIVLFSINLD